MTTNSPVFLQNGDQVKVNDHVYCSPSWGTRDGTPYSIGRIVEFLRPEGIAEAEADHYHYTKARIAWYYRPSDVIDRNVSDPRLLLAAIFSEVCDINQIRERCHVVHRDKITDFAGWKKKPDCFYFTRLFDPYIKKEFEIIQSTDIKNLPNHIRQNLVDKYEYVIVEKEVIPDLTDNIRLCKTCTEWCPSMESVQCDRCKGYFHMSCVNPPLLAKPSRGYGWSCGPCSRNHEQGVDSNARSSDTRNVEPVSAKPKSIVAPSAVRGRGRPRKDKNAAQREGLIPVRHFRGWPFRYFGQYTIAEDSLHDEDLIYPKILVRQGPKFQAVIPDLDAPYSDEERGGDNTVEVFGAIHILTEAEIAEMNECMERLPADTKGKHSVDWRVEVIRRFSEAALAARPLTSVNMKNPMRIDKWKIGPSNGVRYTDTEWTKQEVAAFEDVMSLQYGGPGAELRPARDEVGTRTMPEVVRFYGLWKNDRLREENELIRRAKPEEPIHLDKYPIGLESKGQTVQLPDDEGSVIEQTPSSPVCGACQTTESKTWWKAPRSLKSSVLCDACGTAWRKYADLNVKPVTEDAPAAPKAKDKREGTPLAGPAAKRPKTTASNASTPGPLPHSALKCQMCLQTGPIGKVLKCRKCGFRIHAASYGVVIEPSEVDSWMCEICQNEDTLESSIYPTCVLCQNSGRSSKPETDLPPSPDSALRACKPTEGQAWTHLLCALFVPETQFTDASRLRLVEGVSSINHHKWNTRCGICYEKHGAVVRCVDCVREYHVSCAWKQGHRFGFEMQPVKSSRRDATATTSFKGEIGSMHAVISCVDHDHTRRRIHDMCDVDANGESALQVYCRVYKQAPVATTYGLLRKAKRLDAALGWKGEPTAFTETAAPHLECAKCRTEFSPLFHPVEGSPGVVLCHTCHFTAQPKPAFENPMDVDPPPVPMPVG